jgi:hypothetical protein
MKFTRPYYNLDEIKSVKDLDGCEPILRMIIGNRSAGKTTALLIESLNKHKEDSSQVVFLYRTQDEIASSGKMYEDVFDNYPEMGKMVTNKTVVKGLISAMILHDTEENQSVLGYAVYFNNPDKIKKYSPMFKDVNLIVFDEFVLENNGYLKNEITKFESVLRSICRGKGKQVRDVPVYMLANYVVLLNPYYIFFGMHKRLRDNTRFLRGHGWVAQFTINKSAQKALNESGLSKVFSNSAYTLSSADGIYLCDATAFVEKISGNSNYIFTLVCGKDRFAVREYPEKGIVYIDYTADPNARHIFTFDPSSHNADTLMLSNKSFIYDYLKRAYDMGLLRFKDLKCKNIVLDILSVRLM